MGEVWVFHYQTKLLTVCDEICYCGVYMKSCKLYLFHIGPLKAKLRSDAQSPVSDSGNPVASWTARP